LTLGERGEKEVAAVGSWQLAKRQRRRLRQRRKKEKGERLKVKVVAVVGSFNYEFTNDE
jgi:hypothetical protein